MRTKKEHLSTAEKIALSGVMLLGYEVVVEAFLMCHPRTKTDNQTSLNVMASRWHASELSKKFRQEITNKIARISSESGADLTTRNGIISELVAAVKSSSSPKDSISGLQTLAKLQGLDKPTEGEQSEVRTFFLPYRSKCRTCGLMKTYRAVLQHEESV